VTLEGLVLVVVLGLATYRLTRLVVTDDFPPVRWARNRLTRTRWEWVEDLVTCSWCASGWVAAALVAAVDLAGASVPVPWLVWPASWAVGAWLAHVEPDRKG
jgi:hypothetical protein